MCGNGDGVVVVLVGEVLRNRSSFTVKPSPTSGEISRVPITSIVLGAVVNFARFHYTFMPSDLSNPFTFVIGRNPPVFIQEQDFPGFVEQIMQFLVSCKRQKAVESATLSETISSVAQLIIEGDISRAIFIVSEESTAVRVSESLMYTLDNLAEGESREKDHKMSQVDVLLFRDDCDLAECEIESSQVGAFRNRIFRLPSSPFCLGDEMEKLATDYGKLSRFTVLDIPMRTTQKKSSFSVEAFTTCRTIPPQLAWRGSEKKVSVKSMAHSQWLSDREGRVEATIYPVEFERPRSPPSVCLAKYVETGKIGTLSVKKDSDVPSYVMTSSKLVHLDDRVSEWDIPDSAVISTKPSAYRVTEFLELMNNCPWSSHEVGQGNAEIGSKEDGYTYLVPLGLEKPTRFLPLRKDSTIIFSSKQSPELEVITDAIKGAVLAAASECRRRLPNALDAINKVHISFKESKSGLFPHLKSDHTARYEEHKRLWTELRQFTRAHFHESDSHMKVYNAIDELRPGFQEVKSGLSGCGINGTPKKRDRKNLMIPRDARGKPILPIHFGALTLERLGKVIFDRPAYYTEKYIWPVGYKAIRSYMSLKDPRKKCKYVMEIMDGGETPTFQITCEDVPSPFTGPTATAVWTIVASKVREIRGESTKTNISGPEYFGLAYPTILALVQELPDSRKVPLSIWKNSSTSQSKDGSEPGSPIHSNDGEEPPSKRKKDDSEIESGADTTWISGKNLLEVFQRWKTQER